MLNRYYQEELAFLREMGREFAGAHPDVAHLLAERGTDPDVERLLEGFAFLTGRLRQKLDDEFPELTHTLMGLLWPHYLRPIPSMTMLQFTPARAPSPARQWVRRGTHVDSVPVEGTPCRFRTAYSVAIDPLEVVEAALETPPAGAAFLRLRLRLLAGVKLPQLRVERIRFHLAGEPPITGALYTLLTRGATEVLVRSLVAGAPARAVLLPPRSLQPVGFGPDEALLPQPEHAFPGYRVLEEYFAFPQKFHFVDVAGLERLAEIGGEDLFEIVVRLGRPPATTLRVGPENFLLGCTPAVNLFPRDADPIRVRHDVTEYLVRPAGKDPDHFEVYSVDAVVGFVQGQAEPRQYAPFYTFAHPREHEGAAGDPGLYHDVRLRPSVAGDGADAYLSFLTPHGSTSLPPGETVSVRLTCTNRQLARTLRVGDVSVPTSDSPEFARFRNISRVTGSVTPPIGGDLHWRLISHLSLSHLSLTSAEPLRAMLGLYNFQALYDRQAARENELRLEAIRSVTAAPEDALLGGAPVRGTHTRIELAEDNFAGEGDLLLFAAVLDEFLATYATLNSFSRLTVKGVRYGEVYAWPARLGRQILL